MEPRLGPTVAQGLVAALKGANVYVLFDTSNYMYRGFVFAQDAIADFVRTLEGPDRIAFYSYSRDLSRAALLTPTVRRCYAGCGPRSPGMTPPFITRYC